MSASSKVVKNTFIIVGSVIGAGFVSGREIVSFFAWQDVRLVAMAVFIGFFLALSFLLTSKNAENTVVFTVCQPVIYVCDLIVLSGMLSALDAVAFDIFALSPTYPVMSVICLITSNLILHKGVGGLGAVNAVAVPIIVVLVAALSIKNYSPPIATGAISPVKIVSYVGLNAFSSAVLFMNVGKSAKAGENLLTALFSSLLVAALVFVIASALFGEQSDVLNSDVPLLSMSKTVPFIVYPFGACMVCGIFTTLLSSHYPLFLLVENGRWTVINRIVLSVAAFAISRVGFYGIVSFLYPTIGVIGAAIIVITAISTAVFPKKRPRRTSAPPKRTK